jgi:DNA excision repair protein ERCC-3
MSPMTNLSNPLIIQSDKTVLLEVENPYYEECRDQLARFAELVKSTEHVHTYRITPLSLWNAAAAGMTAEQITGSLQRFSKYDLPGNVRVDVADYVTRYGKVKLLKRDGNLLLVSTDALLLTEISRNKRIAPLLRGQLDAHTLLVDPLARGHVKHALVDFGFPAEDLAG